MLGPQDVGHRVVVRRIVGVRNNRPIYADALGELIEVTTEDVAVRTASGLTRVPTAEIARARRVPDRRRLTATEALERAAAAGWPPQELDHLGDWLLRASAGWTRRGNSALPVGDPDRPLPAAISAVAGWYQERGLPPAISVPLPLRQRLATELERRGWLPDPPVLVQTAGVPELLAAPARPDLPAVELATEPSGDWLAMVAAYRGPLPEAAYPILRAAGTAQVRFASVYGEDRSLNAIGRGAVAGGWLGLSLMQVVPAYRGRGIAGHMVRALARWAATAAADRTYLQVEERNAAAIASYARVGFRTHHAYVVWSAGRGRSAATGFHGSAFGEPDESGGC